MDKVYITIISILCLAVLIISIAFGITNSVKNKEIERLSQLNEELTIRVGSAESHMELQNSMIEQYKVDIEKAKTDYKQELEKLNNKYSYLDNISSVNKTCEEILGIIDRQQKNFLRN